MNGLDRKNVIINLEETKFQCSDGGLKKTKQTEIKNDNLSLLAAEGFCHVSWMKYKSKSTVLPYLIN